MQTFEEKYSKMREEAIKSIGEENFEKIKNKILYSPENSCFYLSKLSGENSYQFYDSNNRYLTTGLINIISSYID